MTTTIIENGQEYQVEINSYGNKHWYQNGELHRLDGPAIEWADGSKHWYQNGQLHRLDGPACEYANGSKHWYQNGQLHRLNGPAVEYANGSKHWYIENIEYSEEKFEALSKEKQKEQEKLENRTRPLPSRFSKILGNCGDRE
jgi:hypothetical protein